MYTPCLDSAWLLLCIITTYNLVNFYLDVIFPYNLVLYWSWCNPRMIKTFLGSKSIVCIPSVGRIDKVILEISEKLHCFVIVKILWKVKVKKNIFHFMNSHFNDPELFKEFVVILEILRIFLYNLVHAFFLYNLR